MATGIYEVVGNAIKITTDIPAIVGGTVKKVTDVYAVVGNGLKKVWSAIVPAGRIVISSSQTITLPSGVKTIRAFLVGAGGGAGGRNADVGDFTVNDTGAGGGAGYTTILTDVDVSSITSINAVVGTGGQAGLYYYENDGVQLGNGVVTAGADGGNTSIGSLGTALGGKGGAPASSGTPYAKGGNGGSGGGGGGHLYHTDVYNGFPGGEDGADGYGLSYSFGGLGQGTTTREFGLVDGVLYSYGGGFMMSPRASSPGNGGDFYWNYSAAGRNGLIIIEWDEQ